MRKGDFKLVRWYEDGAEQLFNLADDLSEERDLAKSNPEKRRELSLALDVWLEGVGAKLAVPNPSR